MIIAQTRKQAFTILELLVVVVVIGIVVVVVFIGLNNYRSKARNAKRVADIKQLHTALELYLSNEGTYPSVVMPGVALVGPSGTTYMKKVPSSPTPWREGPCTNNTDYTYTRLSNNQYQLCYCISCSVSDLPAGVVLVDQTSHLGTTDAYGLCYPAYSWTARSVIGSSTMAWVDVAAASADGTKLVAATSPGYLYTSTDGGANWVERAGAGMRNWLSVVSSADGTKLAGIVGNHADDYGGSCPQDYIYTSSDSGVTWNQQIGSGSKCWHAIVSSDDGTRLAAFTYGHNPSIFTSTDSGVTWTGVPWSGSRNWRSAASFSTDNSKLIAGTKNDFVYISNNGGVNWASTTLPSGRWKSIDALSNGSLIAAWDNNANKIYVSTNEGASWSVGADSDGFGNYGPHGLTIAGDASRVFYVNSFGDSYKSSDGGLSFIQADRLPDNSRSISYYDNDTKLIASTIPGYLYISTNNGSTWVAQNNPNTSAQSWTAVGSSADGTKVVIAASGGSIYTSSDRGVTWTIRSAAGQRTWTRVAISTDGTKLVATAYPSHVYTSDNGGETWTQRHLSRTWDCLDSSDDGTKIVVANFDTLYYSSDSGVNWSSGMPAWGIDDVKLTSDGSKLIEFNMFEGIRESTNGGLDWTLLYNGYDSYGGKLAISNDATKIYAVSHNLGRLYRSIDSGQNWAIVGPNKDWSSIACSVDGAKVVATEESGYIWLSRDSGATWVQQTDAGQKKWTATTASANGAYFVAVEYGGGVYTSP